MQAEQQQTGLGDLLKLRDKLLRDRLLMQQAKEEMATDMMRRDMGIDHKSFAYDYDRSGPALNDPNSSIDNIIASVLGPYAGEKSRDARQALDMISGADMISDGVKNASSGFSEGDLSRLAGGAAEVGLAALPLSGKAAGAAYKTLPRTLGVTGGYVAAPAIAGGLFSSDALASDGGSPEHQGLFSQIKDYYKQSDGLASPFLGAAAGYLASKGFKGLFSQPVINRSEKEASVISDVISNEKTEDRLQKVFNSATKDGELIDYSPYIRKELDDITPVKYRDINPEWMDDERINLLNKSYEIEKNAAPTGLLVGGASGAAADYAATDGELGLSTLLAGLAGGLTGVKGHNPKRSDSVIDSGVKRYPAAKVTSSIFDDGALINHRIPNKRAGVVGAKNMPKEDMDRLLSEGLLVEKEGGGNVSHQWSNDLKSAVKQLFDEGYTARQVYEDLDQLVPKSSIDRWRGNWLKNKKSASDKNKGKT